MKVFITIVFLLLNISNCIAQVTVENSQTAEFYIRNVLLGNGIEVGNIEHIGMIGGLGQFKADPKIIGVKSGLILSTGNADSITGPNDVPNYTSFGKVPDSKQIQKKLVRGDRDLNKLCRGRTADITVIEFDFVPINNVLEFNYVFASEEYKEFVGSPYNDVFGFFLSGPGIKRKINLAVLSDKRTPITVNSVNHKTNKKFYRNNDLNINTIEKLFTQKGKLENMKALHDQIQFDGLTTVLKVHYDVLPYHKYHIKIAIGDAADWIYDSAVFLEAGSFVSVPDTGGKYFENLDSYKTVTPNIDSILNIQEQPDSAQPVPDEIFEITDVYFPLDSYELSDSSKIQLENLAIYLIKNNTFKCSLYGYTDTIGTKEYNQQLSENRARAVMNYLAAKGVDNRRMEYIGRNFENPKENNITEEGRARNRRVEILVE